MNLNDIYKKVMDVERISKKEALFLFSNSPFEEITFIANEARKKIKPENIVTWQIDRNINITNVCISGCQFCNFHKKLNDKNAYITSIEEYKIKINELYKIGGNQVLLQGGCHPKLKLDYYTNLFKNLKKLYPDLKLHALSPPEIAHLARLEKKSYRYILEKLVEAGLDSLPGAGAEILDNRIRKQLSPGKCDSIAWLSVMHEAHQMNILTSATMMFGHIDTLEDRINHLFKIRDLQDKKPECAVGFKAFIPWPFQDENTELKNKFNIKSSVSSREYIKTIAISRIILDNIENIQASLLTVGKITAQLCLHAGANDLGSIMIEENVVSSAGSKNRFNAEEMQKIIKEAGFEPALRDQRYVLL